jgi:hypothetical protein
LNRLNTGYMKSTKQRQKYHTCLTWMIWSC